MKTGSAAHPGISVHSIPVAGGAVGFLFAAGTVLIFLLGIPALRWFLCGALTLGLLFAFALPLFHKYSARREARQAALLKLTK